MLACHGGRLVKLTGDGALVEFAKCGGCATSQNTKLGDLDKAEQVGLVKPLAKLSAGQRHVVEAELGGEHDLLDPVDRRFMLSMV